MILISFKVEWDKSACYLYLQNPRESSYTWYYKLQRTSNQMPDSRSRHQAHPTLCNDLASSLLRAAAGLCGAYSCITGIGWKIQRVRHDRSHGRRELARHDKGKAYWQTWWILLKDCKDCRGYAEMGRRRAKSHSESAFCRTKDRKTSFVSVFPFERRSTP